MMNNSAVSTTTYLDGTAMVTGEYSVKVRNIGLVMSCVVDLFASKGTKMSEWLWTVAFKASNVAKIGLGTIEHNAPSLFSHQNVALKPHIHISVLEE